MRQIFTSPGPARTLAWLAAATLLAVVLAILAVTGERQALTSDFEPRLAFPDLGDRVNEAQKIVVQTRRGKVTVTRESTDSDIWRVEEKGGYTAQPSLVKRTVVGLSDLELVEPRTAQPSWHKHLNLTAPEDKGSGVRIAIYDGEGEELAAIIVGKLESETAIDTEGTIYVRRDGEDQTYVARGSFNLEQTAELWLDRGILDFSPGRIARVEVTPPEGPSYEVLLTDPDADVPEDELGPPYELAEVPEGRRVKTDYAVSGIGNALVKLQLTDVFPAADTAFEAPTTAVFHGQDGIIVTSTAEKQARGYRATFSVSAAPDASEAVTAEAERLNDRLSGHAFAVQTFKGADLTRTMESLTEPADAPEGVDLEAAQEAAETP